MTMANRKPLPNSSRARIVVDSANAHSDKFISLRLAQDLFARGELYELDMGEAYPNSYSPRPTTRHIGGTSR